MLGYPHKGYVRLPAGANQQAIVQPFYLTDPDSQNMPSHWGVGLIPDTQEGNTTRINVAVGYSLDPLRGVPNSVHEMPKGLYTPKATFIKGANGADTRSVPLALPENRSVSRLVVLPNLEIEDGGQTRVTHLAVGLSATDRLMIVDEGDPKAPKLLGQWMAPGKILYRMSAIDEQLGWVAVPVEKPEGLIWYVLSLKTPAKPSVMAELKGLGVTGSMSDGVLYTLGNGQLSAVDFKKEVPAVRGMMRGALRQAASCSSYSRVFVTINQSVERFVDNLTQELYAGQMGPTFAFKKDVPIIAGRDALIRVFTYNGSGKGVHPVTVRVEPLNTHVPYPGSTPPVLAPTFTGTAQAQQLSKDYSSKLEKIMDEAEKAPLQNGVVVPAASIENGMVLKIEQNGQPLGSPIMIKAKTPQPMRVWVAPLRYGVGTTTDPTTGKTVLNVPTNAPTDAQMNQVINTMIPLLKERIEAMAPVSTQGLGVEVRRIPGSTTYEIDRQAILSSPLWVGSASGINTTATANNWDKVVSGFRSYVELNNQNFSGKDFFLLVVPSIPRETVGNNKNLQYIHGIGKSSEHTIGLIGDTKPNQTCVLRQSDIHAGKLLIPFDG